MQDNNSFAQSRERQIDVGLRAHMQGVYNRMTVGVLITGITAWLISSSPALLALFLGGPQAYIFMFAPLAVVWFGFRPDRMSADKLKWAFTAISVLYGISFSVIFLAYAGADIARAFFIATAMFAGLSGFGYVTKKDLTGLGQFAIMGVIGVLFMSIIGIFVPYSAGMHAVIDIIAIIAFSGITAWETQRVKEMYSPGHGSEMNSRMAWSAALTLYISFIAIFIHLLNLLSQR